MIKATCDECGKVGEYIWGQGDWMVYPDMEHFICAECVIKGQEASRSSKKHKEGDND